MNNLLYNALVAMMGINLGMHIYYAYKKNTYQSLRFLTWAVFMAVMFGCASMRREIDNVQQEMMIIEQKIEMLEKGKEPEENGTIHEVRMFCGTDNRHNKIHKKRTEKRENRQFKMVNICTDDGKHIVFHLYK